jgi:hypothetical protein
VLGNPALTGKGDGMVGYRCYILDAEDHILQACEIECEDDAQAESAAGDLLARDPYHQSVEVWELARRIAKLKRDEAVTRRRTHGNHRMRRALGPVA